MKQKSIALSSRLWSELSDEAGRLGIGLAEYIRRVLDAARHIRRHLVDGSGE